MTHAVDGIITQVKKEDFDEHGEYVGPSANMSGERTRHSARQNNNKSASGWSKFVQNLCCCVAGQNDREKSPSSITSPPPPPPMPSNGSGKPAASPHMLITQVSRDSARDQQYTQGGAAAAPVAAAPVSPPPVHEGEKPLLPPLRPADRNKKCLIIDLDETLVHSSFKPVKNPDFVIPVEIDGIVHQVYVLKRPFVDEFLARVGEKFECVLFTASLAKYADPVSDLLDKRGVFRSRLFREACVFHKGNYVKDLARLGRDLNKVLIIDNSPASYAFHPDNAIPVQTWFDDPADGELLDVLPLLDRLAEVDSVYSVLRGSPSPMH